MIYRNYAFFGILAGVRDENVECITGEPRGLPDDCDPIIKQEVDSYDHHSASYLSLDELVKANRIYRDYCKNAPHVPIDLAMFRQLLKLSFVEDVRFVFSFDN
jgi:hypothetical protein